MDLGRFRTLGDCMAFAVWRDDRCWSLPGLVPVSLFECLAQIHKAGSLAVRLEDVGVLLLSAGTFAALGYASLVGQDCLLDLLEIKAAPAVAPDRPLASESPSITVPPRFKVNKLQILLLLLSLIMGAILRGEFPQLASRCH